LGGSYAPDLTRIFSQRGDGYLRAFLVNPGAFHPNAIRTMPRFGLTITETDYLIAFLQAVDEEAGTFPPRPILISGGASADATGQTANAVPSDPVEAGRYWFSRAPANCSTCHSVEPDVVIVGPSLAGIATRAASRVAGQSAEQYIRNSILDPSAFIVPGFPDAMARNLGAALNGDQINQIITFLMTLESN
jgi:nitric oxide reductase subunit C